MANKITGRSAKTSAPRERKNAPKRRTTTVRTSAGKKAPAKKTGPKKWSHKITTDSTHPPEGLFTKDSATIARVMATKKVSPGGLGSAIRMVQMFINRAGKSLDADQKEELEKAKRKLQAKRKRSKPSGK
jgi:hypothetical protein